MDMRRPSALTTCCRIPRKLTVSLVSSPSSLYPSQLSETTCRPNDPFSQTLPCPGHRGSNCEPQQLLPTCGRPHQAAAFTSSWGGLKAVALRSFSGGPRVLVPALLTLGVQRLGSAGSDGSSSECCCSLEGEPGPESLRGQAWQSPRTSQARRSHRASQVVQVPSVLVARGGTRHNGFMDNRGDGTGSSSADGAVSANGSVAALNDFFTEARRRVEAVVEGKEEGPLTVVMGNEASDLDSMVCSLCYSYFLSHTQPSTTSATTTDSTSTSPPDTGGSPLPHHPSPPDHRHSSPGAVIPLINIPRDEFPLRNEAAYLFSWLGLDVSQLLFRDELDLPARAQEGKLQLVLVDHNRLARAQEPLQECVREIVDHHVEEGMYPWVMAREVHQVGSCSTLVAERIHHTFPQLLSQGGVSTLLLSAILADTANLDPASGRCTPRDVAAAALLAGEEGVETRLVVPPSDLFELLREKKFDQSGLSTRDLLRKDFKQWSLGAEGVVVGISAVGLPLPAMVAKDEDFLEAMERFCAEHGLHVFVLMATFYDDEGRFRRQLAVTSSDVALVESVSDFMSSDAAELGLQGLAPYGLPPGSTLFEQGNLQASRKKIQPLLAQYFNLT